MSLGNLLERHHKAGTLTRTHIARGTMYSALTDLGSFDGREFAVSVNISLYLDGTRIARVQAYEGSRRIARPPVQANWPAVKAMREIQAGDNSDDVITRLLDSTLYRN